MDKSVTQSVREGFALITIVYDSWKENVTCSNPNSSTNHARHESINDKFTDDVLDFGNREL